MIVVRSTAFTGEWPTGFYWVPGEERPIPDDYPGADETPPEGLEVVDPTQEEGQP